MNDNSRHPYREYLGDSVYADFDGYHVRLQLDNGVGIHTEICLDPEVIEGLFGYVERLQTKLRELSPTNDPL